MWGVSLNLGFFLLALGRKVGWSTRSWFGLKNILKSKHVEEYLHPLCDFDCFSLMEMSYGELKDSGEI